jgi:hypothetical protein
VWLRFDWGTYGDTCTDFNTFDTNVGRHEVRLHQHPEHPAAHAYTGEGLERGETTITPATAHAAGSGPVDARTEAAARNVAPTVAANRFGGPGTGRSASPSLWVRTYDLRTYDLRTYDLRTYDLAGRHPGDGLVDGVGNVGSRWCSAPIRFIRSVQQGPAPG